MKAQEAFDTLHQQAWAATSVSNVSHCMNSIDQVGDVSPSLLDGWCSMAFTREISNCMFPDWSIEAGSRRLARLATKSELTRFYLRFLTIRRPNLPADALSTLSGTAPTKAVVVSDYRELLRQRSMAVRSIGSLSSRLAALDGKAPL